MDTKIVMNHYLVKGSVVVIVDEIGVLPLGAVNVVPTTPAWLPSPVRVVPAHGRLP